MSKKFIQTALLLVLLCTTVTTYAQISQAPEGIQFQALATDANGHPAAGRVIYVKDAIVAKTATGTIVYSETFKVTASPAGIFTIVLGKGTYASGVSSIANIDWSNGPFFLNLKIAVEPTMLNASWNVNNEYVDLGTSQFWSVPYAMYAGNVKGADTKLNISDTTSMLKPYFTAVNLKANTTDVSSSLSTKVDKVTGKALSTNDYTTVEKDKLAAIIGTNTGDQVDITGNAATATKLTAPKKINGVPFDGTADISIIAVASTLSGTVQVANGGTGATSLSGLVKGNGTNVMTAAIEGVDYLAPSGSAANLTNFPTLNQNTTGNAATATKLATPKNINGVPFDGSANISIPSNATSGTWTVNSVMNGSSSPYAYSNFSLSTSSGFFQRVGNVVSFSMNIKLNGSGYIDSYGMLYGNSAPLYIEIPLPIPSFFNSDFDGSGAVSISTNSNSMMYYNPYGGSASTFSGYLDVNRFSNKLRINISGGGGSSYPYPSSTSLESPTIGISGMYIIR
jgi:hypothetical protein